MDNASKALIIAGAVLIAVMLVSVGVMIYNNAVGVIDTGRDSMDRLSINMENSEFEQYLGTNKRRQDVVQLIKLAKRFNQQSEDRQVDIIWGSSAATVTASSDPGQVMAETDLPKNSSFDLDAGYDPSGYLVAIGVQKHNT